MDRSGWNQEQISCDNLVLNPVPIIRSKLSISLTKWRMLKTPPVNPRVYIYGGSREFCCVASDIYCLEIATTISLM